MAAFVLLACSDKKTFCSVACVLLPFTGLIIPCPNPHNFRRHVSIVRSIPGRQSEIIKVCVHFYPLRISFRHDGYIANPSRFLPSRGNTNHKQDSENSSFPIEPAAFFANISSFSFPLRDCVHSANIILTQNVGNGQM